MGSKEEAREDAMHIGAPQQRVVQAAGPATRPQIAADMVQMVALTELLAQ